MNQEDKKSKCLLFEFYSRFQKAPKYLITGNGLPYDPWSCVISLPLIEDNYRIFQEKVFVGQGINKKVAESKASDLAVAYLESMGVNFSALPKRAKKKGYKKNSNAKKSWRNKMGQRNQAYRNSINDNGTPATGVNRINLPTENGNYNSYHENDFTTMNGLPNFSLNIPNEFLSDKPIKSEDGILPALDFFDPIGFNTDLDLKKSAMPLQSVVDTLLTNDSNTLRKSPSPTLSPIDQAIRNLNSAELNRLLLLVPPQEIKIIELLKHPNVLTMLANDTELAETFMTFPVQSCSPDTFIQHTDGFGSPGLSAPFTGIPSFHNFNYAQPLSNIYSGIHQFPLQYYNNYFESDTYNQKRRGSRSVRGGRNHSGFKKKGFFSNRSPYSLASGGISKANFDTIKSDSHNDQKQVVKNELEDNENSSYFLNEKYIEDMSWPNLPASSEWVENDQVTRSIYLKLREKYPNEIIAVDLAEEMNIPHNNVIQTLYKCLEPRGMAEKFPGMPPKWRAVLPGAQKDKQSEVASGEVQDTHH